MAAVAESVPAIAEHLEVWDAVATLSDRQREAIVLRFVADLPEAEIARAMKVSRGTVASTLADARKSLAKYLADEEIGEPL